MAAQAPFQVPPDNTRLIDVFGPPRDYNNFNEPKPFSNTPECLIGFVTAFLAVSWIFVCFRLFVRLRIARVPGLDDLFVALYLVFTTTASIIFLSTINYGTGRHFLFLTVGTVRTYLKLFYAMNININLAAAFIKLSLLFQFLRLFKQGTWPHRASIVGIIFVSLWGVTFLILALFPCSHIPDAWDIFARDANCWGYASQDPDLFTATFVAHNAMNTVFDIYITAIPLQLYFQPDVSLRTRLGLMVLILMGGTVITLSVWRVHDTIIYKTGWYPTHDPTWYGPQSILLIIIELNVASICASVPIFWPIFAPFIQGIFITKEFSVQSEPRDMVYTATSDTEFDAHYKDRYIMDLVDPFSANGGGGGGVALNQSQVRNEKSKTMELP